MDWNRFGLPALAAGAAITVAASAFAVGAAITSDDDIGGPGDDVAAPESTVPPDETVGQGTAGEAPPVQTATARVEIEIVNFQFTPQDVVIQPGTEVVWTNADPEHSVRSTRDLRFEDSATLSRGDSYSFVFTEPGTYTYICGIHPATMAGTITVEG